MTRKMDQLRDGKRGCHESTDFGIPTNSSGRRNVGTGLGGGLGLVALAEVDAAPSALAGGGVELIVGQGGTRRRFWPTIKKESLTALLHRKQKTAELGGRVRGPRKKAKGSSCSTPAYSHDVDTINTIKQTYVTDRTAPTIRDVGCVGEE